MQTVFEKYGTYLFVLIAFLAVPALIALPFTYGTSNWEVHIGLVLALALFGLIHAVLDLFTRASMHFPSHVFLVLSGSWLTIFVAQIGGATGINFWIFHVSFGIALSVFVITRILMEIRAARKAH